MSSLFAFRFTGFASTAALLAAIAVSAIVPASPALAQDEPIFAPGQPIVTGFSGVVVPDAPPAGSDPLDYTLINPDGPSMQILDLQPDDAPGGQLIPSPSLFSATAADVGQVRGVTLDNAPELTDAAAPNIYLSATSAFGLNIVLPDADGNPIRTQVGDPDATYMAGQWGSAGGVDGYPGSIWMIDGTTGEISLFTTIAANSGAGLGDIVYDPSSSQFFVSDLDTGLIYRLAVDGVILDTFDHGVDGRPAHELEPIEDDGSAMDITDPAFNTTDPSTWGFTQAERKVYGLEARNGRLYYTVNGQVWSVRIQADDGSFGVARWELDVVDLLSANEITGIEFDSQGRMILAQRGAQAGSYDYSILAEPGTSSVVRYEHEFPDDPATPGTWVETPDSYAVGYAADGAQAAGGIALGPDYNEETGALDGACDAYLWATGDSLRFNEELDPPLDPPFHIHGLQGTPSSLVRPANDPPILSFLADYDGNTDDSDEEALMQGHVGAIAFWQECESGVATYIPPEAFPEDEGDDLIEEDDDDEDEEEEDEEFVNLTLEKWASPFTCGDVGAEWWCTFTIRVENTGDDLYWGPVVIDDYLPANNPGATLDFWPAADWSCGPTGPTSAQCATGPVLLVPGDSVVLHEVVKLPKAMVAYCHIANVAELNWFWTDDDDSSDDFDGGVAGIPGPGCGLPAGTTDLLLDKIPGPCVDAVATWDCSFVVVVHNLGPGNYSGPIQVQDTLEVNATATVVGPWNCAQAGPVLTCDIVAPPVNVPPGWASAFVVTAQVPKPIVPALCDFDNEANISVPAAVVPMNQLGGNDFDSVTDHIPDPACLAPQPNTDLEMLKTGFGCAPDVYLGVPGYLCDWQLTLTNIGLDPYSVDLTFKDSSLGATMNTLKLAFPAFCTGPHNAVTCTLPVALILAPGVPVTQTFSTFYPDGPDACSVSNNVSILAPNPGSIGNPAGNDSATQGWTLPNPACAGLPKVNIQKTATGCYDDPSSPFWLCDFDIQVLSYGAVPQPGPIDVHDFNDKPTTFTDPSCVPVAAGVYKCTNPGPLAPMTAWTFQATTQVDPNGVTLADCDVLNTVWITSPLNADPGHFGQATQKVPQLFINLGPGPVAVYCDPPSLALTKTHVKTVKAPGGYNSTFTVRATSMGPDPYIGTVEVDDDIPDGASFVSSTNWSCVPTIDNDVHCSSTFKTIPVGKYTEMTITMHIPTDVAVAAKCNIVNTVNAAISAEVLHSDEGVQYTASAAAELPASLCREPGQCPVNQVMPGGGCCEDGTVWNGKQCAEPRPQCPADSHVNNAGDCVCDEGTEGEPGECEPIQSEPVCPRDSHINNAGKCVCDQGTEGTPGKCRPIEEEEEEEEPVCPRDSHINNAGNCVCDQGTEGRPGRCQPIEEEEEEPFCPDDSRINNAGNCVCDRGTEGTPGKCRPIEEEEEETCPDDSHFNRAGNCVCNEGLTGRPGRCIPEIIIELPTCPRDSRFDDGACRCRPGTHGSPGKCQPDEVEEEGQDNQVLSCPKDSHFDTRRNRCICNEPLVGEAGQCTEPLILRNNNRLILN